MRLRAYIESIDFPYLERWTQDERVHALWCAGRFSYPLQPEDFREVLQKGAREWGDCAYTATEDDGRPVGFFIYNVNYEDNSGFLKCIIVDSSQRGRGLGTRMLKLAAVFAFRVTGVEELGLRVFNVNSQAVKCYRNAGFLLVGIEENAYWFEDETWGRYRMAQRRIGE